MVQIGEGDDPQGTVFALGDKDEVQDPDDASLDKIDQDRQALPGHLGAWELDDQIADRAQRVILLCHLCNSLHLDAVVRALGISPRPEPWPFVTRTRRR